jgi:hypothetical protein
MRYVYDALCAGVVGLIFSLKADYCHHILQIFSASPDKQFGT